MQSWAGATVIESGGRAIFAFHATLLTGEETSGLYEVNCQTHEPDAQAPQETSEGVKANARGVNFNKHVTCDNLFVMLRAFDPEGLMNPGKKR